MCFNGSEFSVSRLQVRIQLGQGSAVDVTKNMLKNEGFGAFYKVISLHLMLLINEALEYFFDPQYSVTHQSNQVAIYMAPQYSVTHPTFLLKLSWLCLPFSAVTINTIHDPSIHK